MMSTILIILQSVIVAATSGGTLECIECLSAKTSLVIEKRILTISYKLSLMKLTASCSPETTSRLELQGLEQNESLDETWENDFLV
ncbi:hypothetical protein CEXT_31661 [Caerostris extrusa]|uniref:Secreted protein n=1 Tax=Caerostris extrusa TaxID=172846 RepID=A0AAV4YE21_CAEEX|nr:hypothetical protein CEXT_31661 [Caerostris extrusa]